MSIAFSLYTTDPNLLGCQLHRIAGEVQLAHSSHNAIGVGTYADDTVLMHRLPANASSLSVAALAPAAKSQVVMFHGRALPVGMSLEDNTQPFRFRRWLFAQVGELASYRGFKQRLWDGLPEHLKRHVRGETDSEVAFALFLKGLRDLGRTDDRTLEPAQVVEALGATARHLERLSREIAPERPVSLALVATNESVLAAVRLGQTPLFVKTLPGEARCALHPMSPSSPQDEPMLRAHERCRSVAIASQRSAEAHGWHEVQDGEGVGVGPAANAERVRI